ncbi:hypothetical protein C8Q80DRAFT_209096 [Daedaleopsis nitida]|nr:hypothetical protein C8Q80DRAFT_209096 [Daedaleopsis nitida]
MTLSRLSHLWSPRCPSPMCCYLFHCVSRFVAAVNRKMRSVCRDCSVLIDNSTPKSAYRWFMLRRRWRTVHAPLYLIRPTMSTSTSSAHASTTRTRGPRSPKFKYVPQGRSVSRAWALEIDEDCLNRWGNALYDKLCPGARATKSPEEIRDLIDDWGLIIAENMAYESYCKFPNLPRLERNVLVMPNSRGFKWLFVLKDNSSHDALNAPVTPEDVEGVKAFLEVKEQDAKWYDVSRRI